MEPIKVIGTTGFSDNMTPGENNTWTFKVTNQSKTVDYNISYHVTNGLGEENGVSVTTFTIGTISYLDDLNGADNIVNANDNVIYTLYHGFTEEVILTITADNDAPAPQNVDLRIEIGREH